MGCGDATGGGAVPPENFGTFSLEMTRFGANSVVYFNRNVTGMLFTARTTTVSSLYIAGSRRDPLTGKGLCPLPGNFGTSSLEMAHFGANSVVF